MKRRAPTCHGARVTRVTLVAHAALVVVLAAGCEDAVLFANIDLALREPAGKARRTEAAEHVLEVTYQLDDGDAATPLAPAQTLSFASDVETLVTPPQALGPNEQVITISLAMLPVRGAALDDALAIGRADPITVPSVNEGRAFDATARAFVAQPGVPELLDGDFPAALGAGTQAACDNDEGFVHVVGGINEYAFDLGKLTLSSNNGFDTQPDVACDVSADDKLAVADGACGGVAFHRVVLDVGGAEQVVDDALVDDDLLPFELCDPFVRVVSDAVWVAGAGFVELIDPASGRFLGAQEVSGLERPVRHALIDGGKLIIQGGDGAGGVRTFLVERSGNGLLAPTSIALDPFVVADPSGGALLFDREAAGAPLTLRVPAVSGAGVVTYANRRDVALDADFVPARMLLLNAGVIAAMDAAGRVQIEGEDVIETARTIFAVSFGRAVLLAGGVAGHDVLVRPFSADELTLLQP